MGSSGESGEIEEGALTEVEDDDEEGEADLTVQILEKAQRRREEAATAGPPTLEFVEDADVDDNVVVVEKENIIASIDAAREVVTPGNNDAVRKLLRAPRYFDSPSEQQSAEPRCYNCGETGHMARACTAARKERPCFLCGRMGHQKQDCPYGLCFRCKKPGHQARDCSSRAALSVDERLCICCGRSSHTYRECSFKYLQKDLAQVECYICGERGHLACHDGPAGLPSKSCYNCGGSGHCGEDCPAPRPRDRSFGGIGFGRARDDARECFRCGEVGHFARECTTLSGGASSSRRYESLSTDRIQAAADRIMYGDPQGFHMQPAQSYWGGAHMASTKQLRFESPSEYATEQMSRKRSGYNRKDDDDHRPFSRRHSRR
eukprot:jgi/Chlat1/4801/Chrsp31S04790